MTKSELLTYLPQIISYLLGTGGFFAYFKGRKERRIARLNQNANALQSMQKAYDDFVKDHIAIINGLKQEVADLKTELKEVKSDFKAYRNEHKNCA